jgi:hypothetical protein
VPSINEGEFTYCFETLRTHYQSHSVMSKKYRMLKNFFIASVFQLRTQTFFFGGVSKNSVDRGQREQGSGDGSPLVRGSAQFANG